MESASQSVVFVVREPVHTQKIQIPKTHHRAIIGNQGENLEELEKITGACISVPSAKLRSEMIEIKGSRDSVRKAVDKIRSISLEQAKIVTERLLIPKRYHPFFNFESCLKALDNNEEKDDKVQSVKIKVPSHYIMKDEVALTGMAEEVAKVAERIQTQYEGILQLNYKTHSLKVDKDEHKFVIGPRRQHINEVFSKTGVAVQVPLAESPTEIITLLGPEESLQEALKIVKEKLAMGRTNHTDTIPVSSKQFQYISNKRSAIQEIQESMGVKVLFPEVSDMNNFTKLIKIVGTKESIIAAKKQIISIMDNIAVSCHINIETQHQNLIKNKRILQKVYKDFPSVSVRFPKVEEQSTQVTLSGPPAQVEKVKNILTEAIDDLINKSDNNSNYELSPRKLSSEDIKEKKSESIIHSKRDKNNNTRIFTPTRNKEKKIPVKQTYNVRINPCVYSRIIGLLGRAVRKIERDHKVHVQFPKSSDPIPDDVLITGMDRKNIESARAVLVELERKYLEEDTSVTGQKETTEKVPVDDSEN